MMFTEAGSAHITWYLIRASIIFTCGGKLKERTQSDQPAKAVSSFVLQINLFFHNSDSFQEHFYILLHQTKVTDVKIRPTLNWNLYFQTQKEHFLCLKSPWRVLLWKFLLRLKEKLPVEAHWAWRPVVFWTVWFDFSLNGFMDLFRKTSDSSHVRR